MSQQLLQTAAVVAATLVCFWVVSVLGRRFVDRASMGTRDSGARARTLWLVGKRVLNFMVILFAGILIFLIWGISVAPFVAVGAAFAAAIGFGAQNFIRDLIAGFFILAEDQFHVGDTVTIAGTTGTVEDVLMRVTVLRDMEGNVHFVPNGFIQVTSNYTSEYSQPVVDLPIPYNSDIDRALAVMKEELDALTADPDWSGKFRGEVEVLGVDKIDRETVTLRARMTTVPSERWNVRREAHLRLKKRFDAEGIGS